MTSMLSVWSCHERFFVFSINRDIVLVVDDPVKWWFRNLYWEMFVFAVYNYNMVSRVNVWKSL